MDMISMPLPIELVLNIITQLQPESPNVLLPPSDPITQTLHSFSLVCHETHRVANACLRQHCVYLSSNSRLASFLLHLRNRPESRKISSMFLAPFDASQHDWDTVIDIIELFKFTAPSLKRLVVDFTSQHIYVAGGRQRVRNLLHEEFRTLENLEEFVGPTTETYFDNSTEFRRSPFWMVWPKLKRLALHEVETSPEFWHHIGRLPELEKLVLVRVTPYFSANIKRDYFSVTKRPLQVLLVDDSRHHVPITLMHRVGWSDVDPKNTMRISTYIMPGSYEGEDLGAACRVIVRAGTMSGTIWDWQGKEIPVGGSRSERFGLNRSLLNKS